MNRNITTYKEIYNTLKKSPEMLELFKAIRRANDKGISPETIEKQLAHYINTRCNN